MIECSCIKYFSEENLVSEFGNEIAFHEQFEKTKNNLILRRPFCAYFFLLNKDTSHHSFQAFQNMIAIVYDLSQLVIIVKFNDYSLI